ncbi:AAA domain-containing protein [Halomonas koreensis]|uniref:AAA domain-containing protein n=1 Tax=Halomonas koreensis TaxID=245385 RepID=A0ABU1G3E0_9GAMM|nr:AAA domain-containing protein [Halomonas koreensis]MDR5867460.1 AAA domain-containing protein [Halomonas koreensis]
MSAANESSGVGQWLRYWRNSLADAESGRGALKDKELKSLWSVETKIYQEGRLPSAHPVLARLFEDEPEETQLVRVVLRPAVYRSLQEHGKRKQALFPEVVTPLICVLWVTRQGDLIPAEPPVIPRDLLSPQADDRFTLGEVEAQDQLLTREAVSVWSQHEALALVEEGDTEAQEGRWRTYYEVSRRLFEQLVALEPLKANFESLGEARLFKVEPQAKGAAQHILNLYDWLGETDRTLPLLERYALSGPEEGHRPCIEALARLDTRLGHANTAYPMASAQRDALAQAMAMEEGEILAVNGPPGTGKTTFVLSVVASRWVKAALEESEPPLIVAASTNNQAVTNILAAFAKDFEENDGPLGGRWLPGIDSYGGFYPARSREDEAAKEYQTPAFYRRLEHPEYLERAEGEFLSCARAAFDDEAVNDVTAVRQHLHGELKKTRDRLTDIQRCWRKLCDLAERLGEDAEAKQLNERQTLEALCGEQGAIEEALRRWKRFCADEPLWLSVLSVLPPVARRRRLQRELFIDEALNDRAKAIIHGAAAKSPEAALQSWLDERQARIERLRQEIEARQELLDERAAEASRLQSLLPEAADFDSLDAIDKSLDTSLRFSLFRLAVHYWEARWLEDCRAQARQLAEEAKEREKTGIKSVRPRWRRRMKLTPCIVSTLHALPSHMMHGVYEGPGRFRQEYLENEIDLLIIDEAGQVAPEVAGASFALAKRALVIGDVHQIKPVSTQVKSVDVGNLRHQSLLDAVDDYDELRDTGRSVVDGSVMRIAQLASRYRYLAEAEPGMFLQEHRRCLNAIIAYCNDLCYRGVLLPMRNTPAKDPTWPPFSYVHVDGRVESPPSGSRVNRLEAETLAEWLATHRGSLEDRHGKSLHEIVGVVTPFKAQAHLIIEACRARDIPVGDDSYAVTVGTVHALQGAERPIILFSAVYSRHDDGGFIDRDPSMLNVAVSRAKDSFMVFGDMDVIAGAAPGSPRYLLGRYLFADENNAQVFTIDTARPDLLALCRHPQVINDAEEHDRCIQQLLESVRYHVALVSPWISLEKLRETELLQCLFHAVERGVEVTVYVDHHFNTTSANQPNAQKVAKLSRCQEALQEGGVRVRVVKGVHSKLIMADDRFMCVGSYNWASAARSGPYKNMETSMLYSGNLREEIHIQLDALNHRAMPDERDESQSLAGESVG